MKSSSVGDGFSIAVNLILMVVLCVACGPKSPSTTPEQVTGTADHSQPVIKRDYSWTNDMVWIPGGS